jgi:outer membrane scaffolding protein for murein synthesis (MipA/OmpV family)
MVKYNPNHNSNNGNTVLNSQCLAGLCAPSLLLAIFFLPAPVFAEMKPKWELGFGFAGIWSPDYRGSDESRGYLLPLPYIIYHGDILRVDRNGIYGRLVDSDYVRFDISIDAGVPVDSAKNSARTGMPDLHTMFEVGPSLEFCVWNRCASNINLEVRLPLRAAFSTDFNRADSRGGLFNPHLIFDANNVWKSPTGYWNFSASIGPIYATERYHDYYYQVDPQYATPTRPAYDANGGYSGWRTMLTTSWRYRKVWFGAYARYDELRGAAFEDSPLMRQKHSLMAGFGIAWIMAESKELVDVRD